MPVVNSQLPSLMRPMLDALVRALGTRPAGAIGGTPTINLCTFGPTPITPDSLFGDFTPADFTGYAAVPSTYSPPINLPQSVGVGTAGSALFECSATGTFGTVTGYYIDDGAGNLLAAEYFDTPIPITIAGDFVLLNWFIGLQFLVPVS